MSGLPLAFAVPGLLVALAGLPILYYLLRLIPPPPQRVPLPTLPLIRDLVPEDQRVSTTPWWLLLLRMLIAAIVIITMAGPIWNPERTPPATNGPLAIIIDNGWSAAHDWKTRVAYATRTLEGAAERPVILRSTAEPATSLAQGSARAALEKLRSLSPEAFTPDRRLQIASLQGFLTQNPDGHILWITDSVSKGGDESALGDFAAALGADARERLTVVAAQKPEILALAGAANASDALKLRILALDGGTMPAGIVRAYDLKGRALGDAPFRFDQNSKETEARLELPLELRNEVAKVEILGVGSAGAVALLDENNSRRRVGVLTGESSDTAQPLVSPAYFIRRALEPFADVREPPKGAPDPVARLIEDGATMIILADMGALSGPTYDELHKFVEDGGVLVRFAGLKLAAGGSDDLLPVKLRRGGRVLGGALSWEQPRKLGKFPERGPFSGLVPHDDITIQRQVLAEPDGNLPDETWAELDDGTPLVTGTTLGRGTIALFHVTADTTWSNLPLSGLFVDLLRRLVATANSGAEHLDGPKDQGGHDLAAPNRILDGFGVFRSPPANARAIERRRDVTASEEHPAGFYGPAEASIAVNVLGPKDELVPLKLDGLAPLPLETSPPIDLRPELLLATLVLFFIDALAMLLLSGSLRLEAMRQSLEGAATARSLALAFLLVLPLALTAKPARAAENLPNFRAEDIESALVTRLAYVVTGNREVDETSRSGLQSLTRALTVRTALEPGEPIGLDLTKDELVFYPILYWPMTPDRPLPTQTAIAKINAYMKEGGTIVFDTRDALSQRPGSSALTPETRRLRQILSAIDVPELEPIPAAHVVTKSFYLLDHFVGRYATGETWIEVLPQDNGPTRQDNRTARAGDRVSPIVITSNDLAGAWATGATGEPRYPLVPGDPRQREFALRGGINLVMYALTGNYKSDQVHVDDLLQRLGQ